VRLKGRPAIRLLLKHAGNARAFRLYDSSLKPYFYLKPRKATEANPAKTEDLKRDVRGALQGVAEAEAIEEVERKLFARPEKFLRIAVNDPANVPKAREALKHMGETYEFDIPWTARYLMDKNLSPSALVEVEFEGMELKKITRVGAEVETAPLKALRILAFDIETYNPEGIPDSSKDPVLMISWCDGSGSGVLSHSKKFGSEFVRSLHSEKEMLLEFSKLLKEKHVDILATYNGDLFDIPYLLARAKRLGTKIQIGRSTVEPKTIKRGIRAATHVPGRVHLDVYAAVSFLEAIGAVSLPRMTLGKVYEEFMGKTKEDIKKHEIWKAWDNGGPELEKLASYSRSDSVACYELAKYVLPLELELSSVAGTTLFSTSRATASQLVEALLIRYAYDNDETIPNKPKSEEVAARSMHPIKGAFVKEPEPGLYENIAALDFRSLYPTIITSHNVDPSALECNCCGKCGDAFTSPTGQRFCREHEGLIPKMLKHVLKARAKVTSEMSKLDKKSEEHRALAARRQSLKILANATYGYTVYPRARWYSRECGESTTAWGRHYIQEVMKKATDAGFNVIYGDTDSIIFEFKKNREDSVKEFKDGINAELPGEMELELEDIYPRGIFVAKKTEKTGAKKKYALINREGSIKIRGFELVRRDWSSVAKNTQRRVLETLLKEGDVNKAVEIVRSTIEELKAGNTPLEDCVIYTQLQKKEKAYEITSPELAAFQKARKAGLQVTERSVIPFVITREGKTISEKAQHVDLAKNYDADYYIRNQVLPAVLKILGALGYDEESLVTTGKQSKLGSFD
jgi:DNA polymerase I